MSKTTILFTCIKTALKAALLPTPKLMRRKLSHGSLLQIFTFPQHHINKVLKVVFRSQPNTRFEHAAKTQTPQCNYSPDSEHGNAHNTQTQHTMIENKKVGMGLKKITLDIHDTIALLLFNAFLAILH